ncbi:MAG: sodium:glutamate symporter [Corynebacterium camporealensis]|uniref:sodium/glutamate symporter n=1 Tax=Corynebacterium camporealensis TaxID=161896 RepID=UPI002A91F9C1|nr:sodium:glutamate symporter [Corynebacterium camporealensis]MDY5841116.1 sodium:glutamate symporter [Corynebacterium camporealensis]
MEEFSAYTLMLDVGWISLLMVIGNVLRHRVKFLFQDLLLPAPITAGLLGLLLGPHVLGWINFSDNLGDYTTLLIAVVFASMAYSMEVGGTVGRGARNMWGYSTMMFTAQWGLFILLGIFLFAPLFETPNWFGMMLPVGFTGGFGTAAAVGGALEGVGADAASSLGFTSATVGTLAAIIGGVVAGNWGIRRGKVSYVPKELPEEIRRGYISNLDERPSLGRATTNPSSIEPLALHLGFIVLTVMTAYGINEGIASIWENVSIPLFATSMMVGLIFRAIMNALGAKDYLDKDSISSISGASTDYLIAFGVASIVPAAIASYWQALLLLFVLGTIFCIFFLLWFPAEFFGERWIERGIFGWGWATATVATGIAILKIVDPKLKSGTLSEYGMAYIGFGPFEISWTIIAPLAVMYGFTAGFGWISFLIAVGIYLTFRFAGFMPPRGTIFKEGIGHVGEKAEK